MVVVCVSTIGKIGAPASLDIAYLNPKLSLTIKKDLKLSQTDISNSNIVALTATYDAPNYRLSVIAEIV